jgi:muramoyltetrapeptide carboxypeptidase
LREVPVGRPARIRAGDTVGVVAPAGVVDAERLQRGVRILEGWGLEVVTGDAVLARSAYLAGSDEARQRDLQRALDDPGMRAVFAARGGYGSQRLVPGIDLAGFRRAPKPVVGFSDLTALLSAMVEAGTIGFHGPMVASDLAAGLTPRSLEHLRRLLTDPDYRFELEVPVGVRPGRARGRLVGGCLSVFVTLLGTPWMPDTRRAVLFLEDVHEWPYRLDRLLTHLRQAGLLDDLAGLVFGTMAACRPQDGVDALDVARELFADAPYPVGFGLAAGHHASGDGIENLALPLGAVVELDCTRGRLRALEPAVL